MRKLEQIHPLFLFNIVMLIRERGDFFTFYRYHLFVLNDSLLVLPFGKISAFSGDYCFYLPIIRFTDAK